MVFTKLHGGLAVATMVVSIGMVIWVIFINTNTIPDINNTEKLLQIMGGPDSYFDQKIQEKSKEDIGELEDYKKTITLLFSMTVLGCIIFFVRGTVLLMTVEEDCSNCCEPVQFLWRQVRMEVNSSLMDTTRSHNRVDEDELEAQIEEEEASSSLE